MRHPVLLVIVNLVLIWAVGVVAMIPVAIWWARDLGRIPTRIWSWNGYHRQSWQWAVLIGWVLGGWPAIAIVGAWSQSAVRKQLISESEDERNYYRLRR